MSAKLIIYHAPDVVLDPFESLLREEGIYLSEIIPSNIAELKSCDDLKIFLMNNEFVDSLSKEDSESIFYQYNSSAVIIVNGDQRQKSSKSIDEKKVFLYLRVPFAENELLKAVKSGFSHIHSKLECERLHSTLEIRTSELSSLNEIGMALSAEQDYDKLLNMVLTKSREITNCDAGSLYLMEENKEGERVLSFKLSQNHSLSDVAFKEHTLPLTKTSMAGYVATTGQYVNLEDAYNIPEGEDYTFYDKLDIKFCYRTKSMLVVPLKDYRNEIIGVLQLINRKKSKDIRLTSEAIVDAEVIPFDEKTLGLVNTLACQAAIVLSHTIQKMFDLQELHTIGIALSTEQNYEKLLELILTKSREETNCDAGSLYLLNGDKEEESKLIFKLVQNDSLANIEFKEYALPLTRTSLAGYVALTGEFVNLEDAYNVPKDVDYTFNKAFDIKFNYRSKSMLVMPMKDHKNKTIGVLQLINRKRSKNVKLTSDSVVENEVVPFDEKTFGLLNSLASQAAVSIENNLLYQNIQNLFEGFVKASVLAIEQRDPSTCGHSERVSLLTVGLAEVVNRTTSGKCKDIHFTSDQLMEIRYAGLLHDFGKVGVRENVLVKANKLYPEELKYIKCRFDFIKKSIECEFLEKKISLLCDRKIDSFQKCFDEIDDELKKELQKLDAYLRCIEEANLPTILEDNLFNELTNIADNVYLDYNEEKRPYLTPYEVDLLSIRNGTLNEEERQEIESHVIYSYEFLKNIPWTKELENVPDIAHAHHEALNGIGYPLKIKEDKIPIQSRMMAITDIYDALTAKDRPYKKAVSHEIALEIIGNEAKCNLVDSELFDMFVKGKVYELVHEK
ncbi:MAG: HD domain-containing phosphohydrolase [Planctomycetota bacterium]|jgi:HD-GYP domain-containing protein (c-di-GMP phosphodiesterase class II)